MEYEKVNEELENAINELSKAIDKFANAANKCVKCDAYKQEYRDRTHAARKDAFDLQMQLLNL